MCSEHHLMKEHICTQCDKPFATKPMLTIHLMESHEFNPIESVSYKAELGMISHKMSLITIFGHKHKIKNFIKNLIFFMKNFQRHLDFGSYLESNS